MNKAEVLKALGSLTDETNFVVQLREGNGEGAYYSTYFDDIAFDYDHETNTFFVIVEEA